MTKSCVCAIAAAAAALLALGSQARAATYYVDPAKGSAGGDGSQARPWRTLEEVAKAGKLAGLKGGDTVLLATGYHGNVTFSGDNAATVTIAAAPGQKPTLSRLTIRSGSHWDVRGLSISPSYGEAPYPGSIVTFGESGPSHDIVVEDCYVFTAPDSSSWGVPEWMKANKGITSGRAGHGLIVRNCCVSNTRFGIELSGFDAVCEGNVVSDFSADGIRVMRDGQIVRYNIVKNVYVSVQDGDANHDDGIQCFLFNKGRGLVKGVSVVGNIILAHEDPNQKLPNSLQGLGFFDGPLQDFVVTDNVVNVDSWHGISLYDAQNAQVKRNVVWTEGNGKMRAWLMFGTKAKLAHDNAASGNYANAFHLDQPGTIQSDNRTTTEAVYREALEKAYRAIVAKYGANLPVTGRPRLDLGRLRRRPAAAVTAAGA